MRNRARFSSRSNSRLNIATATSQENVRRWDRPWHHHRHSVSIPRDAFFQRPLEIRASFSSSAIVRAGMCSLNPRVSTCSDHTIKDGPSGTTAADGLLASLDEKESYQSQSSSASHSHQPGRRQINPDAHTPTRTSNHRISNLVSESLARRARQAQNQLGGRRPGQPSVSAMQELENAKKAGDLSRQITRRWRAGDVYAPHDLSAEEMEKWKNRTGPKHDIFSVWPLLSFFG